jgi:hypothetical protein
MDFAFKEKLIIKATSQEYQARLLKRRQSIERKRTKSENLFLRCASTTVDATENCLQRKRSSPSVHEERANLIP